MGGVNQLKQTAVRVPKDLFKVIENRANRRLRSINNELVILAKMGLSNPLGEEEALKEAEKLISKEAEVDKTNPSQST